MLDKYDIVTIYSQRLASYEDFYEPHKIEKVDHLITAWDLFSKEHPGISERIEINGKTIFDLPEELEEWGIYLWDDWVKTKKAH